MLVQCAQCGAEQKVVNPAALSMQCVYCDAVLMLVDSNWVDSGRKSRLSQGFSRLYRGAVCSIGAVEYQVVGRVRYSFGHGFWDEWYALTDTGEGSWITEDNHEFAVQQRVDGHQLDSDPRSLALGEELSIDGRVYRILEKGTATCLGLEGELPKGILPDEEYAYADGGSLDGVYALGIEYDDDQPTVFIGKWVRPKDITVFE